MFFRTVLNNTHLVEDVGICTVYLVSLNSVQCIFRGEVEDVSAN